MERTTKMIVKRGNISFVIQIIMSAWMVALILMPAGGYGQEVSVVMQQQIDVETDTEESVNNEFSTGNLQMIPYSLLESLNPNSGYEREWKSMLESSDQSGGIGHFVKSNKYLLVGVGVAAVTIVAILASSGGGSSGGGKLPVDPKPDPLPMPAGRP